jgi:S1-C subfamily serine protease
VALLTRRDGTVGAVSVHLPPDVDPSSTTEPTSTLAPESTTPGGAVSTATETTAAPSSTAPTTSTGDATQPAPSSDSTASSTTAPTVDTVHPLATTTTTVPGPATTLAAADRGWLGIRVGTTTSGQVAIEKVAADSPAAAAGLAAGDVLLVVDDQPIGSVDDLSAVLGRHHPGDVVVLTVSPDRTVSVVLGAHEPTV